MKTNTNQFIFKKEDEYLTPKYVVEAIIPFLKENNIHYVWCPADKYDSQFVITLKENNFEVYHSHIKDTNGKGDFLRFIPLEIRVDLILTNPPFSKKLEFIKRANELNIPYMFLLGLPILNYKGIAEQFEKDQTSLIYLIGSKISFNGSPSSFQCAYFTNYKKKLLYYLKLNN